MPDLKNINCSWTKFDVVQVIEITALGKLKEVYESRQGIDLPILKAFVGVNNLDEPLPEYWKTIKKYPKQLRLFALFATIFTHENNIKNFADIYSKGNMRGIQIVNDGKHGTNLRRALITAGASLQNYSHKDQVPFDFSPIFEEGEVGKLFKEVLYQRIIKIGHSKNVVDKFSHFLQICYSYQFQKVIGVTQDQFKRWMSGESLNTVTDIFRFEQLKIYNNIPMLRVNQWLKDWDSVNYSEVELRRKPEPVAYLFSIDARVLKKLSDVHRRKSDKPREEDQHIQRNLNESRVKEIRSYIEGGFPWSTLSSNERMSYDNQKLRMPGYLPTAIIANIIGPGEKRNNKQISEKDVLRIETSEKSSFATLLIPDQVFQENWDPDLKPVEIIDGQHRLWAFDEDDPLEGNFELPVVAYYNLDRAWQAYLFYTINIKPVKINTSLGYDLYPLLRTQEWLENSKEGLLAYRETRAQEIVEALWSYPKSPWFKRINMIGESGGPTMSQAAFVRSLSNSFFKKTKGLFSSNLSNNEVLPWSRTQQAAFIILLWTELANSVSASKNEWVESIRNEDRQLNLYESSEIWDLGFLSKNSFLSRDQGVRGFSTFANDFFYVAASYNDMAFDDFEYKEEEDRSISAENLKKAIEYFITEKEEIYALMKRFVSIASEIDWRTPSAMFEDEEVRTNQMRFRGSGGYSQFWKVLLDEFNKSKDDLIIKYVRQLNS